MDKVHISFVSLSDITVIPVCLIMLETGCINSIQRLLASSWIRLDEKGNPTYLKFNSKSCQITNPSEIFEAEIKIRDVDEFRKVKTVTRNLGNGDVVKHERYQQF